MRSQILAQQIGGMDGRYDHLVDVPVLCSEPDSWIHAYWRSIDPTPLGPCSTVEPVSHWRGGCITSDEY